ncbi:hypothetical protein QTP86_016760 [Hemibagrus guttatus]|nr:hypothetical protein QTP86_016760 [Hemibagrus guttatus]
MVILSGLGEARLHLKNPKLQPQEMSTTSNEAVSEADPFTPTTAVTLEAIKQRQQNEAGTVPEVTTSPTVVKDKSETVVPIEDTEKNEAGTVPEVTTSPTVVKDKSETVVPIEDTEKIAVVKEQSGSEGQETIGPSEKTAKNCEHKIVPATVSSMNKCAACVGPVVSLRWIGLRCKEGNVGYWMPTTTCLPGPTAKVITGARMPETLCISVWAQNPEHLRSTHLRKHVATLSQILNLKNNELDQVADFLGHDIRVHREYYRLPEATIQLAKISKLLLAMEKGRLPDLQGKSLDDIEIEDEINTDGSAGSESENGGEGENLEACTSTPLQIGMRKDQTPNEDEAGGSHCIFLDNTCGVDFF